VPRDEGRQVYVLCLANAPGAVDNCAGIVTVSTIMFKASGDSLGSRELSKKLNEEGFNTSRYLTRKLMRKLKLKVEQRLAYKVTTKRKHSDKVADNLLNQNFNPLAPNDVWAGDITYLKTAQGCMYLAIVMDLYSRRIVGWHIEKRMTTDLISKAITKAVNLI
jgi:putative transposase